MPRAMLELRGLSKSFESGQGGRFTVLNDLSFSVEAGGLTSILGPSGCGKTTLLRIIAGVEKPDGGEVVFQSPKCTLSLVYQEDDLLPWLTVEDNVRLAVTPRGWPRDSQTARVRDCLAQVGLEGFRSFYPTRISGGMKKRASLARAVAGDAQLILCDEPLAFLDFQTRLGLQDLIADLLIERGKTIVYVTHDMYEAVKLSRKCLVMSALPGRIKASFDIPFGYPRDMDSIHLSREYRSIVAAMKEALQEEIVRTDEMERAGIMLRREK